MSSGTVTAASLKNGGAPAVTTPAARETPATGTLQMTPAGAEAASPSGGFQLTPASQDASPSGSMQLAPASQEASYSGTMQMAPAAVTTSDGLSMKPKSANAAGATPAATKVMDLGDDSFVVVKPGDTLGAIARRLYGDTKMYQKIFDANREHLRSPNDLTAGMLLRVPK